MQKKGVDLALYLETNNAMGGAVSHNISSLLIPQVLAATYLYNVVN